MTSSAEVLAYIRAHPDCRAVDVAYALGVPVYAVSAELRLLTKGGTITSAGRTRGTRYVLAGGATK